MKAIPTGGLGSTEVLLDLDGAACVLFEEPDNDLVHHGQISLTAEDARRLGTEMIAASEESRRLAAATHSAECVALSRSDVSDRVLAALQSRSTQYNEARVVLAEYMTASSPYVDEQKGLVERPIKWTFVEAADEPEELLAQIEKLIPLSTRVITKEDCLIVYEHGLLCEGKIRIAIGYVNLRPTV